MKLNLWVFFYLISLFCSALIALMAARIALISTYEAHRYERAFEAARSHTEALYRTVGAVDVAYTCKKRK